MNETLIFRASLIVSKHLSRSEHFKEFVRKFQSNPLPTQVEEILKAEIDGYFQNNPLAERTIELEQALFARNGHDPDALADTYLSHLRANQPLELRTLLSEIESDSSDLLLDVSIPDAPDAELLLSEFPESLWNPESLSNTELRTEIRQTVMQFFRELEASNQILTEQLDEVASLLEQLSSLDDVEQLSSLDDANVSSESDQSSVISPEAAQAISEIVDAVSNAPDQELENVLLDSLNKIIEFNLDPVDVMAAIEKKIIHGDPSTLETSFDPQAANNCVIALSKVVGSQFGKHISEGALTLHAILDGNLEFNISLQSKCLTALKILCYKESKLSVGGTLTLQLTQTLSRLGIPVDIDYNATDPEIMEKLSQGKAVMVRLDVKPIWNGQTGGHIVQVVYMDERIVIVLDTGSRDADGNPDGNYKVYPREKFDEARALGGSTMISTEAALPPTARRITSADNLLDEAPEQVGKTSQGETENTDNTSDNTDSQEMSTYGAEFDERNGDEQNVPETSPSPTEELSPDISHEPINNSEPSPSKPLGSDDGEDGTKEDFGI